MLHPDRIEQITGADVIYELCWRQAKLVRLVFVQYKLWDNKTLYWSQSNNLEQQLIKLNDLVCNSEICSSGQAILPPDGYRLPYCSAFLRPTAKIQSPDVKKITKGVHIPVCIVSKCTENTRNGQKKITSKSIQERSLSHRVFENLFIDGMVGSPWITFDSVEKFYIKHGIFNNNGNLLLHAQESRINEFGA